MFFLFFATALSGAANLVSVKQNENDFVFLFNQALSQNDIKHFVLSDNKSNRYIFDIKAVKPNSIDLSNKDGLKDIRIAQFDTKTIRIVFENSGQLNITHKIADKNFIVNVKEAKSNASNKVITQIRHGKTVVIDSGHGGKDAGTIYKKLYEKDAVLQIGKFLGNELKKRGYTVHFTREKDIYLQLRTRTEIANNKNADMFISIHVNAAPKKSQYNNLKGVETYFLSPARSDRSISAAELENKSDLEEMDFYSKQTFLNFLNREKIIASHKLAIDIQSFVLSQVKTKYKNVADGGVREAPFWVLVGAQMPSILFEVGYITNEEDRNRIFSKEYQQLLAIGIANGVDAYFAKNK